jgi:aldehyde:ferredoxin oxidoreductase
VYLTHAGDGSGRLFVVEQAGRIYAITAKSPETDAFGSTNIGGFFGAEMRYAGYDQIAISGKSAKPVYLWVDDDDAIFSLKRGLGRTNGNATRVVTMIAKNR